MNIEVSPKEHWKYLTLEDAILYCFSLNIDNKIGWRLPTSREYEQTTGIPHFALHQAEFNRMSKSQLNYDIPLRIVPVRDIQ